MAPRCPPRCRSERRRAANSAAVPRGCPAALGGRSAGRCPGVPRAELERQPWRRAAVRAAVPQGAALPELDAVGAAALERPGPSWSGNHGVALPIRAAVPKGAALPLAPPFQKAPRCPNRARRVWRRVAFSALLNLTRQSAPAT
jgi:hypothetical protein